jgi:hypothetical protein
MLMQRVTKWSGSGSGSGSSSMHGGATNYNPAHPILTPTAVVFKNTPAQNTPAQNTTLQMMSACLYIHSHIRILPGLSLVSAASLTGLRSSTAERM